MNLNDKEERQIATIVVAGIALHAFISGHYTDANGQFDEATLVKDVFNLAQLFIAEADARMQS